MKRGEKLTAAAPAVTVQAKASAGICGHAETGRLCRVSRGHDGQHTDGAGHVWDGEADARGAGMLCSGTSAHGQCAKVKGHDASHRNADATHFWDGEPRDYLYLPSPAPDRAAAVITSYTSAAKAYANSLPFADARAAADKAAWDNLLKHADAAVRYLAGQVHVGELTKFRREREGLVRELMGAIRTVQGKGVPR